MIAQYTWGAFSVSFLSVGVSVGWREGCSFACLVVSLNGGWVKVRSTSIAFSSSFFSVPSTLTSSMTLFSAHASAGAGGITLATTFAGGFSGFSTFFAVE